jgi:hypothetical protein
MSHRVAGRLDRLVIAVFMGSTLIAIGLMVGTTTAAVAQMSSQPARMPSAATARVATPLTPDVSASRQGGGASASPSTAPLASTAPSSTPTADASVAPVRRVVPKTPPLPTIVMRAIAASKLSKTAAVRGGRPGGSGKPALPAPMGLGSATARTAIACAPGEIFARRIGVCQKRGVTAQAKPAKAKPVAAKAKLSPVKSRARV